MFATLLLAALPQQATSDPADLREQDLRAAIGFLASEELEGRGSGTRGAWLASEYIAAHFRRLGLKPANDGSFFHEFTVRPRGGEETLCRNTCAILPGTNPKMADQYLVLGGHHDHAGMGDKLTGAMGFPGEVHNGADDNASGASSVMELAEYFAAHPLEHPILFLTFSAEERGLLGSAALVKDKVVDPAQMVAMINLDMVGRLTDDYLFVGGMGTAKELDKVLGKTFRKHRKFDYEFHDGGEAPSDNTNFYKAGVPAIFFFTNIHEDYHLPTDDADKINYAGQLRILNLVRDCMVAFDGVEGKMTYVSQSRSEAQGMPADFMKRNTDHFRRIAKRNSLRGKFGFTPGAVTDGGLAVKSVRDDSAAQDAGLQEGDVVLSINGRRTKDLDQLRRSLAGKKKGEEIVVVYLRDGERDSLTATLK